MLSSTPDTGFFVQIPDESNQRVLHSALIKEFEEDTFTAELQEEDGLLECGQDIFVYFEYKNEFMRQPARIEVISVSPSRPTFAFKFTGDAVSAERRQCYRVSTVMAEVNATFGEEEACTVVDVSATGFALIAAKQYKCTDIIAATVLFEGKTFSGQVRVESVRDLSDSQFRYGLYCLKSNATDEQLLMGLQQISVAVQRQHLRRMSRAG